MSVIPLTIEPPNPTVVQSSGKFDIDGCAVLILGLDSTQLTDKSTSNVSYDLRVGGQYRDHRERGVKEIPEDGVITLHPGAAVIIQTEESVHLPRRRYGTIAPKVSLLQAGLSSTFSKVDPGYSGHLLITLFNLGKTTVTLRHGERFCALTIFNVAEGARLYEKGAKQIKAEPAKQPRRSVRDWLEARHIFVTILLMISTLIYAAVEFFIFIFSRMHR